MPANAVVGPTYARFRLSIAGGLLPVGFALDGEVEDYRVQIVDATPPATTIDTFPPDPSGSASASFTFSSSEAGSTFECQLDSGGFAACTSPKNYTGLREGSHTFEVRAIDAAGNTDPTPASYTWTIDTVAPNTTIDSSPSDPSGSAAASFTFSSSETGSTFECQLDAEGMRPAPAPSTTAG